MAGQGRTVLFVSHNMAAVKRLCQRAVLLSEGRVERIGPVEEVVDFYLSTRAQHAANRRLTPEQHRVYPP